MKFTFFKKMNLFILAPIVIVLVAMTIFSYERAKNALYTSLREQLTILAKTQGESFYTLIQSYRNMVKEFAEDSVVIDVTNAFVTGNTDWISLYQADVDARIARLDSAFETVTCVGVYDNTGKVIMASAESFIGQNFANYDFTQKALKGESVPGVIKLAEHSMGLIINYPIYAENAIVGAGFMMLDLNTLSKSTIDVVSFAKTGVAGVHDSNGVQIMHKNRDYVGLEEKESLQFKGMEGKQSGVVYYEFGGDKRICYFYFIPWLNWYLSLPALESDIYANITELFYTSVIVAFLVINGLGALIFYFARSTSKALSGIEQISQEVSEGRLEISNEEQNLLQKLAKRKDEIGGLSGSFSRMIVALIQTIGEAKAAHKNGMVQAANNLQGIVESCSTATQELSAQVQESSNGAQMQAERIASTVTAVEEMNATILEVTQNTLQTAQIANNTRQKAEESEVVVQDFMGSISKVEKSTDILRNDMNKLSSHVQNINQIMAVISDLADQTNLLALNAAIEAARAGEYGRGFAVVADEVRKLAEKTMASTVSVNDAVVAIQSSTESSMKQVDETVSLVDSAIELAKQCHESLGEIMSMASESAERIGSIAVASEQQSATSEEITRTIGDINSIVEQTSSTMREANVAIMELAKQAEQLSHMVTKMKG